jgi:leucyl aminopeptidase
MAVLGMMYAVAKLKLPIDVVGILSSAENHISSQAFRPGDILRVVPVRLRRSVRS